jgi:hypothetical protein
MSGFGVLITFVFFIYIVSWDRSQLVGLNISLRSIVKASYARHCINSNVSGKPFQDRQVIDTLTTKWRKDISTKGQILEYSRHN